MDSNVGTRRRPFRWEIPHFAKLPKGVNYAVESPTFDCFGGFWSLRLYPNGRSEGSERQISLALVNHPPWEEQRRVRYTLSLLRSNGKVYRSCCGEHTFNTNSFESGKDLTDVTRYSVAQKVRMSGGEVTISCSMYFIDDAES